MKAIFYTNACIEILTSKRRILCDPWLVDGAYGSWLHDPPLKAVPEDFKDYTDIYVSHIHEDHFCQKTMKRLPKKVPVHLCKQATTALKRAVEALGYPVVEHEPWQWDDDLLFFNRDIPEPSVQDTAMVIRDGDRTIFNSNDELPIGESVTKLLERCPKIDVAFLPYSSASIYPASIYGVSDHEKRAHGIAKEQLFLTSMLEAAMALKPRAVVPFSGSYKLAPPLDHKNQFLAVSSPERAAAVLTAAGLVARALNEGDSIYAESDIERLLQARANMWKKQEKYGIKPDCNLVINVNDKAYVIPMNQNAVHSNGWTSYYSMLYVPRHIFDKCLGGEMQWNAAMLGGYIDYTIVGQTAVQKFFEMLSFLHT